MTHKWIYIRKQIMNSKIYRLPRTELDKIRGIRIDIAVMRTQLFRILLKCRKHFMEQRKETKEDSFKNQHL